MALVFRTDQSTPLTNDQVDNNFKYLRDQIALKYSTSSVTAANISSALNTLTGSQTTYDLAQANALNAWTVRNLAPSYAVPSTTDKSSIVTRNSYGDIIVGSVTGSLNGNANTATLATSATALATPRQINGVSFNGTADITIVDNTKLSLQGGTLVGKLNVIASQTASASINFGSSGTAPTSTNLVNGDLWATTSGFFYRMNGQTDQFAVLASPTFTGVPRVPGYSGEPSQIVAFSHLDAAKSDLNSAIALKAPLASPALTGNPTAPTPTVGDNDTSIATTAFVQTALTNKASDITLSYQTYANNAIVTQANSFNVLLSTKAPIDSPTFTGVPAAPTPSSGSNNTQIATTAYVTSAVATIQNALNSAVSALNDAINSTRPIPVGAVMFMPSSTVPYGWLEANGQAVSRTTYAALWAYLGSPNTGNGSTTFTLPDYRGEFIRGWDHGRGVDTNRELGSLQYSQNLSHNHSSVGGTNFVIYPEVSGQSRQEQEQEGGPQSYSSRWPTTEYSGGNESRPRNVALMPVIKW